MAEERQRREKGVRAVSDTFEALRAQGEINCIVGEALGEELNEEFIASQMVHQYGDPRRRT